MIPLNIGAVVFPTGMTIQPYAKDLAEIMHAPSPALMKHHSRQAACLQHGIKYRPQVERSYTGVTTFFPATTTCSYLERWPRIRDLHERGRRKPLHHLLHPLHQLNRCRRQRPWGWMAPTTRDHIIMVRQRRLASSSNFVQSVRVTTIGEFAIMNSCSWRACTESHDLRLLIIVSPDLWKVIFDCLPPSTR